MRPLRIVAAVILLGLGSAVSAEQLPLERYAFTGQLDSGTKLGLWDLLSASSKAYEPLFGRAVAPALEEVRGRRFNGAILYVQDWRFGKILFTQYTGSNTDLVTGKLYSLPLTFQKRFLARDNERGESGINYWPVRGKEDMPMKVYVARGILDDDHPSMMVDYNVRSNARVLERPLLDEIRQLPGTQLYLGRMYYRVRDHHIPFLWFALERVEAK